MRECKKLIFKNARGILLYVVGFTFFSVFTTFSAIADPNPVLDETLVNVQHQVIDNNVSAEDSKDAMRHAALKRAGLVYGAQYGRYARWVELEKALFERNSMLSQIFNFKNMYLDHGNLQPPVLDVSNNILSIGPSGQSREFVNKVYRVLLPANFRSHPLSWQSFLLVDALSKPAFPREALLPENTDEKQIWKDAISDGFHQGVEQANQEFSVRLSALNNAYQGMALYTFLAMRGQIAPPQIVIVNQAVDKTGDGQKMAVGIQRQVITQNTYFVDKPNHWKPIRYPYKFQTRGEE